MLPNLRFAIGAVLAGLVLIVSAFGLAATVRLAHQAKVGPFDPSRTLAYADPADWNQFYDADATRRFDGMGRKTELAAAAIDKAIERAATSAPTMPAPAVKPIEMPEDRIAAISPVIDSAKDQQALIAEPAPTGPAPGPPLDLLPIETPAAAVTEPVTLSTAIVVETANSEPAGAAKVPAPAEPAAEAPTRVAALPPPADSAEPKALAPDPQVETPATQPKRAVRAKAKKKVAKRRAPARTVRPTAQTGFPIATTANQKSGDWLFNRN